MTDKILFESLESYIDTFKEFICMDLNVETINVTAASVQATISDLTSPTSIDTKEELMEAILLGGHVTSLRLMGQEVKFLVRDGAALLLHKKLQDLC